MLQYITRAKERRTITQMVKSKICAVTKGAKKSLLDDHCHVLLTDVHKYIIK